MIAVVERDLGGLDILVNNAGINLLRTAVPIHEYLDAVGVDSCVDLDSVFYCRAPRRQAW